MPHIYKDPRTLAQLLTEKPGRTPFFYDQRKRNLFDSVLDEFDFGDSTYDKSREGALAKLKDLYIDTPLNDEQANDLIDTYITKKSHYNANESEGRLPRKVGKFETGENWEKSQARAQELLKKYPNAQGIIYGLRFDNEQPRGKSGLKNPIIAYDDDLENIARALQNGKEKSRFQFDTLYNN